jgi:tripartite-type tricarboxylate transporter receptor subunit TctC
MLPRAEAETEMSPIKRNFLQCLAIAGLAAFCNWVYAFPDHSLTLVVPYPASGSADIEGSPRMTKLLKLVQTMATPSLPDTLALELTYGLSGALGQNVNFDRVAAGMTSAATRQVAHAAPDGHTLLFAGNPTIAIYPALSPANGVDLKRDFLPVAQIAFMPLVLVSDAGNAVHTARDLVARAHARPGSVNLAVLGEGTTSALAGEQFRRHAGAKLELVNYNGSTAVLNALTTRNVEFGLLPLTAVLPLTGGGRISVIAIGSARRHPAIADTPTIAESGVPGFEADGWFGVFAPPRTPQVVVREINQGINRAMAEAGWQRLLVARGLFSVSGSTDEFATLVERDTARAARLLRAKAQ